MYIDLPEKPTDFDEDIKKVLSNIGKSPYETTTYFMAEKSALSLSLADLPFFTSKGGFVGIAVMFSESKNVFIFPATYWNASIKNDKFFTQGAIIAEDFFDKKTGAIWKLL